MFFLLMAKNQLNLILSQRQASALENIGVSLGNSVIVVRSDNFCPTLAVDAYVSDRYIFFTEGTETDHISFLREFYGENYEEIVKPTRYTGIYYHPKSEVLQKLLGRVILDKLNADTD